MNNQHPDLMRIHITLPFFECLILHQQILLLEDQIKNLVVFFLDDLTMVVV